LKKPEKWFNIPLMDKMEIALKNAQDLLVEDEALAEDCRFGDRRAFNKLVIKYQNRIYSVALRMLRNEEEAKDITQDVFFSAYRAIKRFRGESRLSTWLYRIAINACINRLKSKDHKFSERRDELDSNIVSNSKAAFSDDSTYNSDPEKLLQNKDLKIMLEREITRLSPEAKAILLMRDVEGLAYDEIEKVLDLPSGTVKSRLHRARTELKERLKKFI
jgi:RNA polymerase sigma-70 factor, ECF subfamily